MKKVMIVAGGIWQVPIVKKAKEMGLFVINTNIYEDSPTTKLVDAFEVVDVLDKEKNLEVAKKYKPDAVITDQSDIAVPTVAYINERLKLNGIGSEVAYRFTNKYEMRIFCRENGFPCPDFKLCSSAEEVREFFYKNKKIIIKPIDSQASRGVFIINDENMIEQLFEKTVMYSNSKRVVLAEKFIEGTEFTVDGIKTSEKHHSLAISEKRHYEKFPSVASSLYFSHDNEKYDYDRLRQQNNKLVEKMKLAFGLTHAEYIYSNGEFYLVEIAARGGGGNISGQIVSLMTGIDNNKCLIEMAMGKIINDNKIVLDSDKKNRCCILEFFDFKPGKVKQILGTEFLEEHPNIVEYKFNFSENEYIDNPTDDSKRPGYFIAYADSADDLKDLRKEIGKQVKIIYGKDN